MFAQKIRIAIVALFLALSTSFVALPALASADFKADACGGITAVQGGSCTAASGTTLTKIIKLVVNILSIVVGAAAVIMIIISGFKYITSGGDSSSLASAKATLIYAIIGLMIVALAKVIVHYTLAHAK